MAKSRIKVFFDFIKKNTNKIFSVYKISTKDVNKKALSLVLSAVVTVSSAGTFVQYYDIGYDVYFENKNLGSIKKRALADESVVCANQELEKMGASSIDESNISTIVRIAPKEDFISKDKLKDGLMLESADVCLGYALVVDGKELFTCSTREDVEQSINEYINQYSADGTIKQRLEIIEKATLKKDISLAEEAVEILNESDEIKVYYSKNEFFTEVEPYNTFTFEDPDMYIGESKVLVEGADGERLAVKKSNYENKTMINEELSTAVITKEPKVEVIKVGAKQLPKGIVLMDEHVVTSRFGSRWGRNHTGLDMSAPTGTEVRAYDSGEVIFAGVQSGYGNYIKIRHSDGMVTGYAHLSKINVSEGQIVNCGDVIGLVGSTGRSTGPHLHFEVMINEEFVNPESYVQNI